MNCPLCNTPLPDGAVECTRCDWVYREEPVVNLRDQMAFWLSLIPGLGHLYKGHILLGGLIFFVIGPGILGLSLALALGTLGVSLVIPVIFMVSGMFHAYRIPDLRAQAVEAARLYDARPAAAH